MYTIILSLPCFHSIFISKFRLVLYWLTHVWSPLSWWVNLVISLAGTNSGTSTGMDVEISASLELIWLNLMNLDSSDLG